MCVCMCDYLLCHSFAYYYLDRSCLLSSHLPYLILKLLILTAWVGHRRCKTVCYGHLLSKPYSYSKNFWDGWDAYAQQSKFLDWTGRTNLSLVTFVCIWVSNLQRLIGLRSTVQQINLINPHESEDIQLSPSTKAVKDLQVSPCGRLALLASLGKKLSILRCIPCVLLFSLVHSLDFFSCNWFDLECFFVLAWEATTLWSLMIWRYDFLLCSLNCWSAEREG